MLAFPPVTRDEQARAGMLFTPHPVICVLEETRKGIFCEQLNYFSIYCDVIHTQVRVKK